MIRAPQNSFCWDCSFRILKWLSKAKSKKCKKKSKICNFVYVNIAISFIEYVSCREWGYMMKYSLRAQAIFHCISRLQSQYRHSRLQLQHWTSWRSTLDGLILHIAPTARQYRKLLTSWLSNTDELNFNIIMFSSWECIIK